MHRFFDGVKAIVEVQDGEREFFKDLGHALGLARTGAKQEVVGDRGARCAYSHANFDHVVVKCLQDFRRYVVAIDLFDCKALHGDIGHDGVVRVGHAHGNDLAFAKINTQFEWAGTGKIKSELCKWFGNSKGSHRRVLVVTLKVFFLSPNWHFGRAVVYALSTALVGLANRREVFRGCLQNKKVCKIHKIALDK